MLYHNTLEVYEGRSIRATAGPTYKVNCPNNKNYLNSVSHIGKNEWNNLPSHLRLINDYKHFKSTIKSYFNVKRPCNLYLFVLVSTFMYLGLYVGKIPIYCNDLSSTHLIILFFVLYLLFWEIIAYDCGQVFDPIKSWIHFLKWWRGHKMSYINETCGQWAVSFL